jgi:hypothetical protein
MRLSTTLLVLAGGLALSGLVWWATGGRFAFFFLPLVLGLPFVWRRSR